MKYTKEVKTALLAIVAIILLIFGYSFLKGNSVFDSSRTYYAIYDDVEGLSTSSPVTINGLKVGKIKEIGFFDESGLLLVSFSVDTELPFSENSIAQVYGGGLIGGKSLAIIPKYEEGNLAEEGDTLPSEIEEGLLELVNERLTPLQAKIETTIESADSLLTSLNQVLNPRAKQNIETTFEDISIAATSLKGSAQSVEGLLTENRVKLDTTFTNLAEMSANLNNFSDTLAEVEIKRIVNDLEVILDNFEEVSYKINEGDGTLAKFINDPTVYNNLEQATRQLEQILQDIKLNPDRYVHFSIFGDDPGPYVPPKDIED